MTNTGELVCHASSPGHQCHFDIEIEGHHCRLKAHHGGFLASEEDQTYNANGGPHHLWKIEHVRDGHVAIKGHNVSWWYGISMFGHNEAIDAESYDRCHWRVELVE